MCIPAGASASEGRPFAISSFTTQTTQSTAGNVNEPTVFNQAAGHPAALTTTITFAQEETAGVHTTATGDPKDLIIDLPPGLLANPWAVPRCSGQVEHCPTNSQVGTFALHLIGGEDQLSILGAIVNMTPYTGQAAEFGLEVPFIGRVILTGRLVRTAQGYTLALIGRRLPIFNLAAVASGAPAVHLASLETTLWGVPAAAEHNPQRGLLCFGGAGFGSSCDGGGESDGEEAVPFLTMPDACSGEPPTTVVWADSWEQPGDYVQATASMLPMGYCERLPFWPEVSVRPETQRPEAPDGLGISIQVHQFQNTVAAAPALRAATITLPQGVAINPAVGDGLQGCDATGPSGINIPTGRNASGEPLRPGEVGPGEAIPASELGPKEPELAPGHCPNASIVGVAEAITPLLAHPVEGHVYIATPGCGGEGQGACTEADAVDGNLYRIYIELGAGANIERNQNEGVLIKLAGTVQANPATGQITVRLSELPELPISALNLHLFGGELALLANPSICGAASTTFDLEPWSAPHTPDASPSSSFNVSGCHSVPLNPGFLAGSMNSDAAAASPFAIIVTRGAGEPDLSAIQVQTPPGLSAMLSSVPPCAQALASTGECPPTSRIGSSTVAAGSGPLPLKMPGSIYLTSGYGGAPFGLAIVTDGRAGPLNLGTVVTRARVTVDPVTAALTITTDPLPQIVLGVPLRIQRISLDIDRPGFIINPTNCGEEHVTGTIADAQGALTSVSNRYPLADCAILAFKPRLAASTTGHTTETGGASLDLALTFGHAVAGAANLARIKLALPEHLPSRLAALQGACPEKTFNSNPAACAPSSLVGVASAQTPFLSAQLTGPVYLITHGRGALPSPVLVLQGDGVTLILRGSTLIGKAGTTSVTFGAIPDVPLQTLRLYLPQGAHSLLGANTNLCGQAKVATVKRKVTRRVHGHTVRVTVNVRERLRATLAMPTELAAHNGAVIHETTKIAVVGCSGRKARQ
jgi:hypothetical protein